MLYSAIGPHCADNYNEVNRRRVRLVCEALNSDWVNILRGQNPTEALFLAAEIAQTPTQVMVRHRFGHLAKGDERTIIEFPNPRDYHLTIARQYSGYDVVLVAGNEQTLPAYDTPLLKSTVDGQEKAISFVEWIIQEMRYAHDDGMRLAVARFPSWHPYRDQFKQFDQRVMTYDINGRDPIAVSGLAHAFKLWPEHVLSLNVYYTRDNEDAIDKAIEFWKHVGQPEFHIGEFGILLGVDTARDGYKSLGWSEEQAANNLMDVWVRKLKQHGITASFYNFLTWHESDKFELTETGTKVLVARKSEMLVKRWERPAMADKATVRANEGGVRVRAEPVVGAEVDKMSRNEIATLVNLTDVEKVGQREQWIEIITPRGKRGYTAAWFYAIDTLPDEPDPEPDPCEGMMTLAWHEAQQDVLRSQHALELDTQRTQYEAEVEAIRQKVVETMQDLLGMITLPPADGFAAFAAPNNKAGNTIQEALDEITNPLKFRLWSKSHGTDQRARPTQ